MSNVLRWLDPELEFLVRESLLLFNPYDVWNYVLQMKMYLKVEVYIMAEQHTKKAK